MLRKRVKIMAENILKSGDSQHDSHAATHSHYENIHNERDSIRKTGYNRKKSQRYPQKKNIVFIVRMLESKRLQKRHKSTLLMQPFMP